MFFFFFFKYLSPFNMWTRLVLLTIGLVLSNSEPGNNIVHEEIEVTGPGLNPKDLVMPARYFFIYARGKNYSGDSLLEEKDFEVHINGRTVSNQQCRVWVNVLNRKDSSLIVRYKLYETCYDLKIIILYQGSHIRGSPFETKGPVQPEDCYCPEEDLESWLQKYDCPERYSQMELDLKPFPSVDFNKIYDKAVQRFNNSKSSSVCHYVIRSNEIYRACYGEHVGFKIFMDAILLSLTRKVHLPDVEFFNNLGDWPLIKNTEKTLIPIFSWCGSKETMDIVMPTYLLTESSLECMGRVSLDMLSVQGNIDKTWTKKEPKAFWRGRDSSRERLKLIEIARKHPELMNASLTNFFFFPNEEPKYGPKEKHISFFKFFDYKYQVNIDGTVAAYRFPYLLAGDSLVFKQNSYYYEHFYQDVNPWEHFIPFKTDLSDLVDKINWAIKNDEKARKIMRAGQSYARTNLLPQHIFCYHAVLFKKWSERLVSTVKLRHGMKHVSQKDMNGCKCQSNRKEEL